MHALGCSPKPYGKSPLLKTPHTSVIGYREMKVLHTLFIRQENQDSIELDLSTCCLTFTVLKGAMHALPAKKTHQRSHACCNTSRQDKPTGA